MLLVAERGRIDLGEPANDGESGDLRLRREPALDRRQMRIELRGHANARLVMPFRLAMSRARLDGRARRAERARKRQWISRRCADRRGETPLADALAELFLRRADLREQRHRIEIAIRLAQPALDRSPHFRMRQRSLIT